MEQCDHAGKLTGYRLEVMEWPRSQMAGMLPFESPSVLDSADPCISVEDTAKGLIPYRSLES